MSDNNFLLRLKGQQTPKSVVEVQNDKLVAPFVGVPQSTDTVGGVIVDKDSSVVVAKGAQNWQIDGSALTPATTLYGDGRDFLSEYVATNSLWVNASYIFPQTGDPKHPVAEIFNAQTKWVLQLCGKNLLSKKQSTIPFTIVVQIGTATIMTKTVTVAEQAGFFRKLFVLDFSESAQKGIKAQGGAKLTVQLLCGDSGASATIYNGMTVLTALQRRVDASAVASQHANLDDYMNDYIIPSEYFSNAEFINQVEEGDKAYAVFTRDGDNMNLSGWDEPIPSQVNNAGKFLKTSGDGMSWYQIQASDVGALPDTTKYGATFDLSMDASTFVITATLKDQDGNTLGSTQTIDLPLESVVVNGSYDNTTKSLILTLQNGNTIKVPVGDLVSGLQFVATTGDTMTGDLNVPNINFTNKGKLTYQVGTSKINLISADDSNTLGKINVGQGNVQTNVNSATFTQTLAGIQYKILNNNDTVTPVSDVNKIITQENLANVATSGAYSDLTGKPTIPTVNNPTITITQGGITQGSFSLNQASDATIELDAGGGGSADIDNLTITENASNEIQAVAVIDQNTGIVKPWSGTGAEYEAIPTKDPDTVYMTDDLGLPATEIGKITEALNNKMDIGTPLARDIFSPDEWVGGAAENILAASIGTGTITFTKNWQEYDYLWFSCVSDSASAYDDSPHWLSVKWMLSRAAAGDTNLAVLRYASGIYWYVNPQTWTETTMPAGATIAENSHINRVYAIKLKNITATNVGYLNYVGLFATVAALNASAPTAMGQWAIVEADENHSNLQTKYFSTKNASGQFVWSYGGTIDTSLAGADYVVEKQEPTEGNGYTWYRKYSDGWVEQGGLIATGASGWHSARQINLPVTMANVKYIVNWTNGYTGYIDHDSVVQTRTVSSFTISLYTSYQSEASWEVKGMYAQ